MKSKQYKLSLTKDSLILKEDVSQTVTTAQFGKLIKNTVGSTFKFLKTTAESLANLFVFSIGSILTMFASEDVKKRIVDRYENRKKEIFKKYDHILKDLELENGHEAASFLFSPSLYVYEKITKDIDRKGIIGDNLSELIDDPYNYVLNTVPKIKSAFVGADPTTKKEVDSLYRDYRDINKQSKLYDQIKKLGVDNLEKMLQDKTLDREQQASIRNLIEYLKKNESLKSYRSSSLKIGKNLILEEDNTNKEEILNLINSYTEEVKNNIEKIAKELVTADFFKEKFDIDRNELDKSIKEYSSNNIEIIEYYEEMSKVLNFFVTFLDLIRLSIEKNSLNEMVNFGKTANVKLSNTKVKKEFKQDYLKGAKGVINFVNGFIQIANDNNKEDSIKTLKILIKTFNVPNEIEKLKSEISNTIKILSPEGDISKNYNDFLENITNLNKNEVVSDQQKEIADSGIEKLEQTSESFNNLLTKVEELIRFFNNIKVENDSNESEQ